MSEVPLYLVAMSDSINFFLPGPPRNGLAPAFREHVFVSDRNQEREFFIDNLLVRIRLIIDMILVDRPCAMGV